MRFFSELKRRNVYKVAVAYAVVAWVLIQLGSIVFPTFGAPAWVMKVFIALVVLGFPIALLFAWAFELTSEGIRRAEDVDLAERHSRGGAWIYIALIGVALSITLFFVGRYTASNSKSTDVSEKSIAVLPFESLSEDKANAYFAEGIQDEILARLSKIADLKVISRTSTQKYKSAPATNLREIAQQLGVAHVLEGTVQKAADQVRVTVQLINALNDSHLWAESYDRKLVDLFQVESEIAQKVAGSLEAKLTGREKQQIATRGTKNTEAYDTYLHALALVQAQSVEDTQKFVELSGRVVELDPNFMEGWALLTLAETQLYLIPDHTAARLERARHAAERTMQLGPDTAEAHRAMGVYYYCLREYDRALAELALAKERAPNNADVQFYIGLVQRRHDQVPQSIESMLAAAKLDPLNIDIWTNIARTYRGLRQFEQARRMFDHALAIRPHEFDVAIEKAEAFLAEGDLAAAAALINPLDLRRPGRGPAMAAAILTSQRRFDDAIAALSEPVVAPGLGTPFFVALRQTLLADTYQLKGERDKARPLFEQAARALKEFRAAGDDGLLLLGNLIDAAAFLGDRAEVERSAADIQRQLAQDHWGFFREEEAIARAYTVLGDFDRALPLLQTALSKPGNYSVTAAMLRLDPFWDPVRSDPRFQQLAHAHP